MNSPKMLYRSGSGLSINMKGEKGKLPFISTVNTVGDVNPKSLIVNDEKSNAKLLQ